MNETGVLRLDPILVPKPWGGKKLAALGKVAGADRPAGETYGESWEVADLPDGAVVASDRGRTPVRGGPHHGKTLRRLIEEMGSALLGSASATAAGDFPLLFKLLDTAEHLSIQVHPGKAQAATSYAWQHKTESWYVLDAEPGATILKGFRPGVSPEDVRSAAGTSALADLMMKIPVRPGDFHHLPAGTIHALGAGVTIAEVQTPSDTTFRLYDWTREYGRQPRRLQISEALDALSISTSEDLHVGPMTGEGARLLVDTPHYWIREHRATGRRLPMDQAPELRLLMVVRGQVEIDTGDEPPRMLGAGSTVLIPASAAPSARLTARGIAALLEVGIG